MSEIRKNQLSKSGPENGASDGQPNSAGTNEKSDQQAQNMNDLGSFQVAAKTRPDMTKESPSTEAPAGGEDSRIDGDDRDDDDADRAEGVPKRFQYHRALTIDDIRHALRTRIPVAKQARSYAAQAEKTENLEQSDESAPNMYPNSPPSNSLSYNWDNQQNAREYRPQDGGLDDDGVGFRPSDPWQLWSSYNDEEEEDDDDDDDDDDNYESGDL
jgi:hypothetical protein